MSTDAGLLNARTLLSSYLPPPFFPDIVRVTVDPLGRWEDTAGDAGLDVCGGGSELQVFRSSGPQRLDLVSQLPAKAAQLGVRPPPLLTCARYVPYVAGTRTARTQVKTRGIAPEFCMPRLRSPYHRLLTRPHSLTSLHGTVHID